MQVLSYAIDLKQNLLFTPTHKSALGPHSLNHPSLTYQHHHWFILPSLLPSCLFLSSLSQQHFSNPAAITPVQVFILSEELL